MRLNRRDFVERVWYPTWCPCCGRSGRRHVTRAAAKIAVKAARTAIASYCIPHFLEFRIMVRQRVNKKRVKPWDESPNPGGSLTSAAAAAGSGGSATIPAAADTIARPNGVSIASSAGSASSSGPAPAHAATPAANTRLARKKTKRVHRYNAAQQAMLQAFLDDASRLAAASLEKCRAMQAPQLAGWTERMDEYWRHALAAIIWMRALVTAKKDKPGPRRKKKGS